MDHELPDVQAGFRKGRGTRDQIDNIHWITEKARDIQKIIYFSFIDYTNAFDCVSISLLNSFVSFFKSGKWYHMIFVFVWLTLCSIKISKFIHVAANGIISSFFKAELYSIVYMYHIFFIHFSVDRFSFLLCLNYCK